MAFVTNELGAQLGQGMKLPRYFLRRRLAKVRVAAGKSLSEAAAHLKVGLSTMRRYELVETKIDAANLKMLCSFYGMSDEAHAELESLREALSEINWWRGFGPHPDSTAGLLEIEQAATVVQSFDLLYIPGLLQTPAYARAIMVAVEPGISRQRLNSGVELRLQRKERVFDGAQRDLTFIVDQAALERMPSSAETRRAQLAQLRRPPEGCRVLVLPFESGPHPAAVGFTIFDFDSEEIPRAVHVEWSETTKGDVVEEDEGIKPYEQYWAHLRTLTLTEKESSQFLKQMMES
jgi:transcriptional regulator with XRE-family HTH domain